MIRRDAEARLAYVAGKYKAVAVVGPRQSGKSTLVKALFRDKPYVSLENPDMRREALSDTRGFLSAFPNGAVIDEAQRAPELFSYLQEILDNSKKPGLFILTGSNNFLFQESISQSLAGRIAYVTLLPFSIGELHRSKKLPKTDDELMIRGFFPPVYSQKLKPADWCPDYIRTYIEKDIRQLKNIGDLILFEKFVALLAGRSGQELNLLSLGIETGVDYKTIQSWIGLLEASYVIYLIRSYHRNFNKTIIKRPKVYFTDTALLCSLLRIRERAHLHAHPLRGAIFENMVMTELLKKRLNKGLPPDLYYWRDKTGHEIDAIIDDGHDITPIEIKSSKTPQDEFFKNLRYWNKLSKVKTANVLYGGDDAYKKTNGEQTVNWRKWVLG